MRIKHARFVEEYLLDLNGKQAAIRAGYKLASSEQTASRLLGLAEIQRAIAQRKAQRSVKCGISQERVLEELAALAFSNIDDYLIDDAGNVQLREGAPSNAMAAVQSVKRKMTTDEDGRTTIDVELKLWSKTEPLKLVGRHVDLKGVTERVEHTFPEMTPEAKRERLKELAARAAERAGAGT